MGGLGSPRCIHVLGALAAFALVAAGSAAASDGAPHRVIVGLDDEVPDRIERGSTYEDYPVVDLDRTLDFLVLEAASVEEVREAVDERNRSYVERDGRLEILYTPDDPRFGDQYGPQHVDAPQAWDTTLGNLDVAVCVVDTGLRKSHIEFPSDRILGDHDFWNDDGSAEDGNGHGTHVTGIAAAQIGNDDLIAGVGNVGIYAAEALSSSGAGYWSDVAAAIRWCADRGTDTVINLSLGGGGSSTVRNAVDYAWNEGSLIVAAAGNDGCSGCVSAPAKYDNAMAVSCTNQDKNLCYFSSYGSEVELSAPGRSILSTWAGGDRDTEYASGTSMSSPHVAGGAALAWSLSPELSNDDIRERLHENVEDLGSEGRDDKYGYGLLDVGDLVASIPVFDEPHKIDHWTFDDGLPSDANTSALWHLDDTCRTPPSQPHYVGYHRSDSCSFHTGERTRGHFTLPVDLRDVYVGNLSFQHIWEVEATEASSVDVMTLRASDDEGDTWTGLGRWSPADGNPSSWQRYNVSLSTVTESQVLLRWTFDSKDDLLNDGHGWLLDDVHVHGATNMLPLANSGGDRTLYDDDNDGEEAIPLDGSGSEDEDGNISEYRWLRGGSEIATGQTATVTWPIDTYDIELEIVDDEGGEANDSATIQVAPNQAPDAAAPATTVSDPDADGSETVTLDGSNSSDPDGSITSAEWRIDGEQVGSSLVENVSLDIGTYTANLTVTDNGGTSDAVDVPVEVVPNQAPTAVARDRYVPTNGSTANLTLDGTLSEDEDGSIETYTWTENGTTIATGPDPTVELETGEHNVTLTVEDNGGKTRSDEATIFVVGDLPPTAQAGPNRTAQDPDADGQAAVKLGTPVQAGRVPVEDSSWRKITFEPSFEEPPIVLVQPQTENGGQKALYGEAAEVSRSEALVRYCENDGGDACDTHAVETVAWLALPTGRFAPQGNRVLDAGGTPGLEDAAWARIPFAEPFASPPVVVATTQTLNGSENPSLAQTSTVGTDGFHTRHCEYEAVDGCDTHAPETNGWAAFRRGHVESSLGMEAGTEVLTDDQTLTLPFDSPFPRKPFVFAQVQSNNGGEEALLAQVLSVSQNGTTIHLCEHEGADDCDTHTDETVAWVAIEPVTAGWISGDPEGDLASAEWLLDGETVATGVSATVQAPVGESEYTLRLVDGQNQTREDSLTVTVDPNQPPTADAGRDDVAWDDDGDGEEAFELDAQGSSDPDGSIASYTWTKDGAHLAEGPTPTVTVPVGDHTLMLTVGDDGNGTASDSVNLTVEPNQVPTADGVSETVWDGDDSGDEETPLYANGSVDPDGEIIEYRWSHDGDTIAYGHETSATLPVGTETVGLQVTDNGGETATTTVETDVRPNLPPVAQLEEECVADVCKLDASDSTDRGTYVEFHRWDIDDELIDVNPSIHHRFEPAQESLVELTAYDTAGAQDDASTTINRSSPDAVQPPRTPPDDPPIHDPPLIGYQQPQVVSAWFSFDVRNVYVGLEAGQIAPPAQAAAGRGFTVSLDPLWTPEDPTWNGTLPAGHTPTGLRFHATPVDPTSDRLELQLVTESPLGRTVATPIQGLEGAIDPETDIVWWVAPRDLLQIPTEDAKLANVTATATAGTVPVDRGSTDGAVRIPSGYAEGTETRYASFDQGDEGFQPQNEQLASEIQWVPSRTAMLVETDRTDPADERMVQQLAEPLDGSTNFTLSARWDLVVRGHWQFAFPVYLSDGVHDGFYSDPGSLFAQYQGRDPSFGEPRYRLVYTDSGGEQRLDVAAEAPIDVDPTFVVTYDASSQELTAAILGPPDHIRAIETYTLGSNPNDGFSFTELGIATDGRLEHLERRSRGYTDDILLRYVSPTS